MKKDNLTKLFISELKDIMSAEEQIVQALPEVMKATEASELKEILKKHLKETNDQVSRLKKIFSMLGISEQGEKCEGMESLIQECIDTINEFQKSALRDASLISKLQRIKHYEISVYGTLSTFAKILEMDQALDLLKETLNEEMNADKKLTKIAEGSLLTTGINKKANE